MLKPTNQLRWRETKFSYEKPLITRPPIMEGEKITPAKHFVLEQLWREELSYLPIEGQVLEEWREISVAVEE